MKSKKSFAQILQGMETEQNRRIRRKLPAWQGHDIVVPTALALEQCSSSVTASYKASLAVSRFGGRLRSVCDITGGLGSDCAAFAAVSDKVWYFEKNPRLADAARHNCSLLGLENIEFRCGEVGPDTLLPECDLIYADPARRDSSGHKLFMLEDCSPDIAGLYPFLLERAPVLMVKLSPMADLSMVAGRFGSSLREVHIVCHGGEVKELLCVLEAEEGRFRGIRVAVLSGDSGEVSAGFSFLPEEEQAAPLLLADCLHASQVLLEPSAGMLKSGAFKLVCTRFGLRKLAPSTHLYVLQGESLPPEGLFRRYAVEEVLPMDSGSIAAVRSRGLHAGVSARNIRMDSEELRKRTGCIPGGDMHLFGCMTSCQGNVLVVSRRIL